MIHCMSFEAVLFHLNMDLKPTNVIRSFYINYTPSFGALKTLKTFTLHFHTTFYQMKISFAIDWTGFSYNNEIIFHCYRKNHNNEI